MGGVAQGRPQLPERPRAPNRCGARTLAYRVATHGDAWPPASSSPHSPDELFGERLRWEHAGMTTAFPSSLSVGAGGCL